MTNDAALEARKKAQQTTNAFHRAFGGEDGQIVLDYLTTYFRLNRPAFERSLNHPFDPIAAAIRDGQREVILFILHKLSEPAKGDADMEEPKTKIVR